MKVSIANVRPFVESTVRKIACLVTLCLATWPVAAADALTRLRLDQVKVGGEIGRRIDVTVENNLLALDADKDFLPPFERKDRKSGYIGLGKLIDAIVRFAAYTGDEEVIALKRHLIDSVIEAQEPDGYIGMFEPEYRVAQLWDVHEMAYIIYALCSDYELSRDARSLQAARSAADYIIGQWSRMPKDAGLKWGVHTYVAVTGLERAMITISRLSGDSKYIDFCRSRLALAEWYPRIVIGRRPLIEGHIYAYLCRCLAQLELHRIAPDKKLKRSTGRAMEFFVWRDGMAITGGTGQWEIWTNDQDGRGALAETCATAYQVRLCESLLRLAEDSLFADLMERIIYNTLFAAQSPDGRNIRYYSPLEGPRKYHSGDTYCCPCNYRRIIAELPGMIYYRTADGLAVNLFTPSEAKLELADGLTVAVRQETDYPNSGNVAIHVDPARTAEFAVRLRIPAWCDSARVTVNDRFLEQANGRGFHCIERTWRAGDCIRLQMPMRWRIVRGRQRQAGRAAVMRGPVVFCLNPEQSEELAPQDGADLGQITLDLKSLGDPVPDDSVRPGGQACIVEGWRPGYACSRPGNLKLRLTEFPDPGGRAVYFRLQEMGDATDDELLCERSYMARAPGKDFQCRTMSFGELP